MEFHPFERSGDRRLARKSRWKATFDGNAEPRALHQDGTGDRFVAASNSSRIILINVQLHLGLQAALLPKPYKEAFANIFDAAPNIPIEDIQQVFKEDFAGKRPDELFTSFSETPIASASIAQVHEALIDRHEVLPDGTPGRRWQEKVAVKVQKSAIRKQMEWDLWSYRTLMFLTEKLFAMPSMSRRTYVSCER
jgi:aarF domain-containing kinase